MDPALPPHRVGAHPDHVAGAVVMWGAIELHRAAMRAQHCRIDRVIDVAGRLGVPAVRHRDLRVIATRYGVPVAADLQQPPMAIGSAQGPSGLVARTGTRRPLR